MESSFNLVQSSALYHIFIGALLLVTTRNLTILLHEIGHAIPALIFTKGPINIYIGSYGNPENGLKIHLKRVIFFFKYDAFQWNAGLCCPEDATESWIKNFLIILGGPLMSLIIALTSFYLTFSTKEPSFFNLCTFFLFFSSAIDFYFNIEPNARPIKLHNGSIVFNDGYQLMTLFGIRKVYNELMIVSELFNSGDRISASDKIQNLLNEYPENESVLRMAVSISFHTDQFTDTISHYQKLETLGLNKAEDYTFWGVAHAQIKEYETGLNYLDKALELSPDNMLVVQNKGYTYLQQGKYELAIEHFDKTLSKEPENAYALSNRGLAKTEFGEQEEGLKEMKEALRLDENQGYVHRNLGIYYFERESYKKALEYFEKAKSLGQSIHLLDEYLMKTNEALKDE